MIILDTNVLSALMRPDVNPLPVTWLDAQPADRIWTTSVCLMEVRVGLLLMPDGKRRRGLAASFDLLLSGLLRDRVLPLDTAAAEDASAITVLRQSRGRPVEYGDYQIAGIVRSRGATLATRNVEDFADLDIPLINPWSA